MKQLSGLTMLFILIGCGGGGGGDDPGGVTGTVHGMSFPIDDAISATITTTTQQGTSHFGLITMANTADLCGDASTDTSHPNQKGVIINLVPVPTAAGTYTIYVSGGQPVPPTFALLNVSVSDATCHSLDVNGATATSGTVDVTAVSGDAFSGTFDVALDSGDHITGKFNPAACPALPAALASQTQGPCV